MSQPLDSMFHSYDGQAMKFFRKPEKMAGQVSLDGVQGNRIGGESMAAYLKIENPGVCPPEAFLVLGVSLASTSQAEGVIGTFGSGSKHAIAVLLRHDLSPVVYSSSLRMEFGTKPQNVDDGLARKEFARVVVKFGGSDPATGSSRSGTQDLGFVLDYGQKDWTDVALALREFVSNAIDRCIRERGDWNGVVVDVVDESQVRAKSGSTRIFVPLNAKVMEFHDNLGKWFLHFSEPDSLKKAILPKANRNLSDRRAAVIYRRGVRVREFESSDQESLFDYNLNDLRLDECRKASDWDVRHACGKALANADRKTLAVLFQRFRTSKKPFWEGTFDSFSLQPSHGESRELIARRQKNWTDAFMQVAGDDAVLSSAASVNQLERKGFAPVVVPEEFVLAAAGYGCPTPAKVLSKDELQGREISEPSPDARTAVDFVWDLIEECRLTNGKVKPQVSSFTSILTGGMALNGYYRDNVVYINENMDGTASIVAGHEALSDRLLHVALEEVAHHVTGATDNSRDFQHFLLDLAIRLCRRREAVIA